MLTGASPKKCIDHGLGFLSEDRKQEGLAQNLSISDNLQLSRLSKSAYGGFVSPARQQVESLKLVQALAIKCRSPGQEVRRLSGGNQQKVAIGRVLFQEAEILLLDEPTRGIDVGAKFEIYTIINQLAAEGKGILMISSEMPELLGTCDRIYVMNEGRIVAELSRAEASQESIMRAIMRSGEKH